MEEKTVELNVGPVHSDIFGDLVVEGRTKNEREKELLHLLTHAGIFIPGDSCFNGLHPEEVLNKDREMFAIGTLTDFQCFLFSDLEEGKFSFPDEETKEKILEFAKYYGRRKSIRYLEYKILKLDHLEGLIKYIEENDYYTFLELIHYFNEMLDLVKYIDSIRNYRDQAHQAQLVKSVDDLTDLVDEIKRKFPDLKGLTAKDDYWEESLELKAYVSYFFENGEIKDLINFLTNYIEIAKLIYKIVTGVEFEELEEERVIVKPSPKPVIPATLPKIIPLPSIYGLKAGLPKINRVKANDDSLINSDYLDLYNYATSGKADLVTLLKEAQDRGIPISNLNSIEKVISYLRTH